MVQHEIRGVEQEEHLEQGYGKPISQLIGAGNKGREVEFQVGIGTKQSKHKGGYQLHLQFLPAHRPPYPSRPLHTSLVSNKTTDEEEQGHSERDEDLIHEGVIVHERERYHMGEHHEDHGEATEGVDELDSGGFIYSHK